MENRRIGQPAAMAPVAFNGCFGWLHSGGAASDTAVLICPALSRDALDSYHGLRVLAAGFAAAGYPTLRFDYPATGDSRDAANTGGATEQLWDAWQRATGDAADYLRRATGATRLILCGLRIGAALAALAATSRDDIAGVLLLAPVLKGQSYLRQLWIEAQLQNGTIPPLKDGIDFQEIHFNADAVQAISAVDLSRITFSGRPEIAVFAQAEGKRLDDCAAAWTRQGAGVTRFNFEALAPLLHHNLEDDKGQADFTQLIAWARQAVPAGAARRDILPVANMPIGAPGYHETPLRFGPAESLFGILCQPDAGASTSAVIIANTGRDPRQSPGRFSVEFARRLACEGVASLRIDFAGLGDSIGPPGHEDTLSSLFDLDRGPDLAAAATVLAATGYRELAAYGLCAGAYHVLQGALTDARISKLLLANIPLFTWNNGERMEFARHRTRPPGYFLRELMRLQSWPEIVKKKRQAGSVIRAQFTRLLGGLHRGGGTPAQRNMQALSRRGVETFFLFAAGEVGLDAIAQDFADPAAPLAGFAGVTMQVLPELDHMLGTAAMRRIAADRMINFLLHRPAALPAAAPRLEHAEAGNAF